MSKRHMPPGRTFISCVVVVKPFGPNQRETCSLFVQASKTSSRGASHTRVSTISRSRAQVSLAVFASMVLSLLFGFQLFQVVVEAVQALFPELALFGEPG